MAKGHYERKQERLMRLWAELEEEELEDQIQLDDDDESLAADELETQDHNTDPEEDIDENDCDEDLDENGRSQRIPYFVGKDKIFWWNKHCPSRTAVHTRSQNLVTQAPGARGEARQKKEPLKIWKLFFTPDLLEIIVQNTNKYIEQKKYQPTYKTARPTDETEVKAFLGLLYIISCKQK
nr:unnamed protein product [Callosobruchus chinensis]